LVDAHESKGKTLIDYAYEDDRAIVEAHLSRCIIHGSEETCEARWYYLDEKTHEKTDSVVWVKSTFFPISREVLAISAIAVHHILVDRTESFADHDREVLQLLANDNNVNQISNRLNRSPSTIDSRIRSLKERLGKNTLHGLVSAACGCCLCT
jgi:hypothetical protein